MICGNKNNNIHVRFLWDYGVNSLCRGSLAIAPNHNEGPAEKFSLLICDSHQLWRQGFNSSNLGHCEHKGGKWDVVVLDCLKVSPAEWFPCAFGSYCIFFHHLTSYLVRRLTMSLFSFFPSFLWLPTGWYRCLSNKVTSRRVKRISSMSEWLATGVLTGVIKVSGLVTSSVTNSRVGKKIMDFLPGEVLLASLDGFGMCSESQTHSSDLFLVTCWECNLWQSTFYTFPVPWR